MLSQPELVIAESELVRFRFIYKNIINLLFQSSEDKLQLFKTSRSILKIFWRLSLVEKRIYYSSCRLLLLFPFVEIFLLTFNTRFLFEKLKIVRYGKLFDAEYPHQPTYYFSQSKWKYFLSFWHHKEQLRPKQFENVIAITSWNILKMTGQNFHVFFKDMIWTNNLVQ